MNASSNSTFTGKALALPDGQKPIIPKDEGLGVMHLVLSHANLDLD
jgi:hypothetical protein